MGSDEYQGICVQPLIEMRSMLLGFGGLSMSKSNSVRHRAMQSLLFLLCYLVTVASACAQLPRIRLDRIHPAGGQVGTQFPVTVAGELADAATDLIFSHPDIEAIQQREPASEFRVAHRKPSEFDVQIGPHVPPGRYEVRALGPAGLSAPRSFVVSRLPDRQFIASNNSRQAPFSLIQLATELGEAVNASTRADERDYYQFTAEQQRPLLIQVFANRIDSKMDATLAVYTVDGRRLHKVRQSLTRDPVLTFEPPADGQYLIEVSDATFQGGLSYRLEVSELPWVEAIFPPIAQANVESSFTLYGYNLPGGVPVSGFERDGHLQSVQLTFTPDFGTQAGWQGTWWHPDSVAVARIVGQHFELPDRLSVANPVFLAEANDSIVLESESSQDVPQRVSAPVHIAGQFYPRRDRDYFEFEATKGASLWISLTTDQFGLPSDPVMRIQRKTTIDGKTTFRNIATADDLEGPPRTRDSRRLSTSSVDVSYRFHAPEDGTYVVSVSDQFNSAQDDPRLAYLLSITQELPDFQLVAFADPERFPDDKIARPNGTGILPGGSAAIRVRLLSQHGFNGEVVVDAENLPAGVTATPLVLRGDRPEGLVVVQADRDAPVGVATIRIIGRSAFGDQWRNRVAKSTAIIHGANNTDAEVTSSRLTSDLPIAVLDVKPNPVQLAANQHHYVTCRGRKTPIPIALLRRDDFQDVEVSVAAVQVPSGIKIDTAKSKNEEIEVMAQVTDPNLNPGRYTIVLGSKVKDKRPKNPVKVAEASADLDKVLQLVAAQEASTTSCQQAAEELAAVATQTSQRWEAVRKRASEPRNRLTQNLLRQRQAAKSLQGQLSLALQDVTNQELQQQLAGSEDQIARLRAERVKLREQLGAVIAEVAAVQSELTRQQDESKRAQETLAKQQQELERLSKEQELAAKRFKEIEAAELNIDTEFWVFSPAITLDVKASPVEIQTQHRELVPGSVAEVPILLTRNFEFADQVTIRAEPPKESGLSSTPLVLGPGVTTGKLPIIAADDASVKSHTLKINVQLNFNGVEISEQVSTVIDVVPAEVAKPSQPTK